MRPKQYFCCDQITARLKYLITVNDLQCLSLSLSLSVCLCVTHTSATAALVCCECELLRNLKIGVFLTCLILTVSTVVVVEVVVVKLRSKFDARCVTHASGLMIVMFTGEGLEERRNTGSCLMAPRMKRCLFGAQFAAGLGRLEADFKP